MIPHLYIHIPFCTSKCHYCGFYSETGVAEGAINEYPALLLKEFKLRAAMIPGGMDFQPQTIYIGGGTPSLLGAEGFVALTDALHDMIDISRLTEWSVEVNPASATPELFDDMLSAGVTRTTFGVQSFNKDVLTLVNRVHTAEQVSESVQSAKRAGFQNIGIDLIAGLPGISADGWQRDLQLTLELEPKHISVYNLSVEPQTELFRMIQRGISIPNEKQQLNLLSCAEEILSKHDFNRYEISNCAKPGYECLHNLGIWRGCDYLGLGPSAASRIERGRIENLPDLNSYIENIQNNSLPPQHSETLNKNDDAVERALFALRLKDGFSPAECIKKFGVAPERAEVWKVNLKKLASYGAVERGGRGWRLTKRGYEVCDFVIRELI